MKNPVMVEAGYKAWATRRANEKKKKADYSRRAKKSWVTRRKNAK